MNSATITNEWLMSDWSWPVVGDKKLARSRQETGEKPTRDRQETGEVQASAAVRAKTQWG